MFDLGIADVEPYEGRPEYLPGVAFWLLTFRDGSQAYAGIEVIELPTRFHNYHV